MIKRAIFLLLAFLTLATTATTAQEVGSWKHYALYNGIPSDIVVNQAGKVYFLSLGRLYSYDPEADETHDYINDFTGRRIGFIRYNPEQKFLFTACEDGTIVLIYDNGTSVTMTDIPDANLRYEKNINGVAFTGNDMYVTTSFGLVVFDTGTHTVRRSGIYGKKLTGTAVAGDKLFVSHDGHIYIAPRGYRLNSWNEFTSVVGFDADEMMTLDNTKTIVAARNASTVKVFQIDTTAPSATEISLSNAFKGASKFITASDGTYFTHSGKLWKLDNDGKATTAATLASPLNTAIVGLWKGLNDVWCGTADGVGCYDLTTSKPTVKNQPIKPADAVGVERVGLIKGSPDGQRIYVSAWGPTRKPNAGASINGSSTRQQTFVVEGEQITDVTEHTKNYNYPGGLAEDPDDQTTYYMANRGVVASIKDGTEQARYTSTTGLLNYRNYDLDIDNDGNLWVVAMADDGRSLQVLPSEKRKNFKNLGKTDWLTPAATQFKGQIDTHILVCRRSGMIMLYTCESNNGILFRNTAGTPTNFSDDTTCYLDKMTDQDGRSINVKETQWIIEDRNGALWIAVTEGIFIIDDPTSISTANPTMRSIKVPRNDGTGFADYLLDGETVTMMSVDGNNNKWIATAASGLYCVSADGTEIIANYNTKNSALPTNVITAVYADPLSSNVYVGTNYGLLRYTTDYSPSSDNYDDVYAYPNPVKPGYSGWITIANLMDNSLVKIADASGQVVYQGRSNGGMFTWDGCNSAGSRVKSGVYFVFASQNANDSSSGAVTKILIMN